MVIYCLASMTSRYLAAEEKDILKNEKKELDEIKEQLKQYVMIRGQICYMSFTFFSFSSF